MNRVVLFSLIMFASALALYAYHNSVNQQNEATLTQQTEEKPDFTAKSLRSRSFNTKGILENQIWASDMEHYSREQRTQFHQPKLVVYSDGEQSGWTVTAEQGELAQGEQLNLSGKVVINAQTAENQLNTMLTEALAINLSTLDVSSDQAVTVKGARFNLQGVGLRGNVKREHIEVLGDVKATYESEK